MKGEIKMKCSECNYCYRQEGEEFENCHFDPDSIFPAPCEEGEDIFEDCEYSCFDDRVDYE